MRLSPTCHISSLQLSAVVDNRRMITPTKSIRVPEPEYRILLENAKKTGRKMQFLLAKAIQRCYGESEKP